jgi:hypothetical protein
VKLGEAAFVALAVDEDGRCSAQAGRDPARDVALDASDVRVTGKLGLEARELHADLGRVAAQVLLLERLLAVD